MDDQNKNIVLFDGVCNLCNDLVRFIIKRDADGKFKFASLQSEIGQQWLRTVGLPVNEFESFVLISGNEYYLKSTAALKMLRELGGIWKAFYVFILVPLPVRDFLYDMIAKSRYRIFGRRDTCMVPTPELQERFL
ncbi:MAG: thiol-disulfide oxidoreductase DCC family protein [Bacteroidota bacterium]|nr:thiol-disulfide oxidoreductase DCC family protein [Bacteroidota bacterium]